MHIPFLPSAVLPRWIQTLVLTVLALTASIHVRAQEEPPSDEVTITRQPANATLTEGDTLNLSVAATGTGDLAYQWFYQATAAAAPSALAEETGDTLTISEITLAKAGLYYVSINDTVASAKAVVTVKRKTIPLTISQQPAAAVLNAGAVLKLSVVAQGDGTLSYQWFFGATAGTSPGQPLAGQTAASLNVPSVSAANAGFYKVRVADANGALDSAVVQVTVNAGGGAVAVLADNGFLPERDGFSFENYGDEFRPVNLTAEEIRRLFGDRACATIQGSECILTPPGKKWMEAQSAGMKGGHCEGFAALSMAIFTRKVDVTTLGAAVPNALAIRTNPRLQREIGFWFVTQATQPTSDASIKGTPVEVENRLIEFLKPGAADSCTIGIYAPPEIGGGHAVTPIGIEDMGNGIHHILVYDNNHPNKVRRMIIDRNKNTWSLGLAINPSEPEKPWTGTAASKTFELTPTSARLQTQICPFCEEPGGSLAAPGDSPSPQLYNELHVDGDRVRVLVSDDQGRRIGQVGNTFVREIPGAFERVLKSAKPSIWPKAPPPIIYLPVRKGAGGALHGLARDGMKPAGAAPTRITVTLDGTDLAEPTTASVTYIGPGYDLEVDTIEIDPGQVDTIEINIDGTGVAYTSTSDESPDVTLGYEAPGADFDFTVGGIETTAGATLRVNLDRAAGVMRLSTTGNKGPATYSLAVDRYDDTKVQSFFNDAIDLKPTESVAVNFLEWPGDKAVLKALVQDAASGASRTLNLEDEDAPGGPKLEATVVEGGKIQLTWPASATDYALEASADIAGIGWEAIPEVQIVTDLAGRHYLTPATGAHRFFRLHKR